MLATPTTVFNPSNISHDFFHLVNADVSLHIRSKLQAMDMDLIDLELHNSSSTRTFRVYVTLKRAVHLKALHLAEKILMQEIEQKFSFRPHAFYWRYLPSELVPTNE
ncbi:hypothetical protein Q8A64_00225 [Oxalobacteraceae bacterium R-40]|uniref:Uncharacterized protein n=1 Tax=Keguizhuia sedimenti TaxID=3064264 RepID=A0ABU1BIM5_9BURK|nr:hypothetical protein [Oxalobacteraceae bacterium R-40]